MKPITSIIFLLLSMHVMAQNCLNTYMYPNELLEAPNIVGDTVYIDNTTPGSYAKIEDCEGGETYVFGSSISTDYITLRSNDQSTVLAHGPSPLAYQVELNDNINMHINTEFCGTSPLAFRSTYITKISLSGVGVGVQNPQAKLHVSGKIRLSDDPYTPAEGSIRFNSQTQDFEGYNGRQWVSFTTSYSEWGKTHAPLSTSSQKVTEDTADEGAQFGHKMAKDENTLVVTAPWEDSEDHTDCGAIYIYEIEENNLTLKQKIKNPIAEGTLRMGEHDITIDDDRILVSIAGTQTNTEAQGALIFHKVGDTWQLEAMLEGLNNNANVSFGQALGLNGEYAAITRHNIDNGSKKVWIYKRNGSNWEYERALTGPTGSSKFGHDIAMENSYLFISDPEFSTVENTGGIVNVYATYGTIPFSPVDTVYNPAESPNAGDEFGDNIAINDLFLTVSSPGKTINGKEEAGAVYVFDRNTFSYDLNEEINQDLPESNARFGEAIESHNLSLVISKGGTSESRKAYVYEKEEQWRLTSTLIGDQLDNYLPNSDYFGSALTMFNNLIIVSAKRAKVNGMDDYGRLHLFSK